jgi:hypothetical protein
MNMNKRNRQCTGFIRQASHYRPRSLHFMIECRLRGYEKRRGSLGRHAWLGLARDDIDACDGVVFSRLQGEEMLAWAAA